MPFCVRVICFPGETSVGKLTLVDLAGSERSSKMGEDQPQQRLVETKSINQSLTSLGQVFTNLHAGSNYIPYRNSKLTHCLQDLISGDSKIAFFVNISPDISNLYVCLRTVLYFAARKPIHGEYFSCFPCVCQP